MRVVVPGGAMLLAVIGLDPLTALGGSIATMGNVGPGFGRPVLLLFHRETWKARKSFH
jgi:Trk-type K+ transport system membrane component